MIMKRIVAIIAISMSFIMTAKADDRPVTFEKLPEAVRTFITQYFPDDKVSFATRDDDFIAPDYTVVLVSGVKLQFHNNGALESIDSRHADIPAGLIPVQVMDYVKTHYQNARVIEYEVGRKSYEVKLSNGMELKFNRNFNLIGIDD